MVGWDNLEFDDSGWEQAVEIASPPWTNLSPSTIPPLTEDITPPVEVKAVELARPRPGYFWNFDLRDLLKTNRTGLRSAPPGERSSILFTEVITPRDCTVHIYTFPNYEPIPVRVNHQTFGDLRAALDSTDGPVEVTLRQGANLVMLRTVEWPSLLFATSETLTFTADRFVSGAAWTLITPLNELNGELAGAWMVESPDDLLTKDRLYGIPASANKPDIFALTCSQEFFALPGGFCSYDITRITPRPPVSGVCPAPVDQP